MFRPPFSVRASGAVALKVPQVTSTVCHEAKKNWLYPALKFFVGGFDPLINTAKNDVFSSVIRQKR